LARQLRDMAQVVLELGEELPDGGGVGATDPRERARGQVHSSEVQDSSSYPPISFGHLPWPARLLDAEMVSFDQELRYDS